MCLRVDLLKDAVGSSFGKADRHLGHLSLNGQGIYHLMGGALWFNGWGTYGLNGWGSYDKVSCSRTLCTDGADVASMIYTCC